MLKKIIDNYIFKSGYNKGKKDAEKEKAELIEQHKIEMDNQKYQYETIIKECEFDKKLAIDKVKKIEKKEKRLNKEVLEMTRYKKLFGKYIFSIRDKSKEVVESEVKQYQELNQLIDELEALKCKQID